MSGVANSTDLRDYVQVYQNLLKPETCAKIIEWADQHPDADSGWDGWEVAKSAVSNTENEVTKHRKCDFTMMNEHRGVCVDQIEQAIYHIQQTYPYHHGTTAHTGIQIMRYGEGHYFEEHIDHYGGAERILSMSIYLNDQYTGGELTFWQDKLQHSNMHTGDAVVFPSNLCFPHEVKPVLLGTRYVIVVWLL